MSLVKAQPGQEPEIIQFLAREPLFNMFQLANLPDGLGPDLEVWLHPGRGLLMRRRGNWLLDAGPDPLAFDNEAAAATMDEYPPDRVTGLVGVPEAVEPLFAALRRHHGKLYSQRFATMENDPAPMRYTGSPRSAGTADLGALAELYANPGDMSRSLETIERALHSYWVLEDGGRIVCAAYVSARTNLAAMIGGVFTPERDRGRGYASSLVHAMSTALRAQGLQPCLFYHNPDAGRIYLRLGYREIGGWRMVRFHP